MSNPTAVASSDRTSSVPSVGLIINHEGQPLEVREVTDPGRTLRRRCFVVTPVGDRKFSAPWRQYCFAKGGERAVSPVSMRASVVAPQQHSLPWLTFAYGGQVVLRLF